LTCGSLLLFVYWKGNQEEGGKSEYIDKGGWKMLNWTRNVGVKRCRTRALDGIELASNAREAKPAPKNFKNGQIRNNKRKHINNNKKTHINQYDNF
jgi:hypothetical protein